MGAKIVVFGKQQKIAYINHQTNPNSFLSNHRLNKNAQKGLIDPFSHFMNHFHPNFTHFMKLFKNG